MLLYYFFAFLIGGLVIVAPIVNGQNAMRLGTVRASFYNYLFATVSAFIWMIIFSGSFLKPDAGSWMTQVLSLPPYYFIGGLGGCVVILLMNYFTVRIKAFYIVILPFIGQMTMGLTLDAFNGHPMSLKKIIGALIIVLGLWIHNSHKSMKEASEV